MTPASTPELFRERAHSLNHLGDDGNAFEAFLAFECFGLTFVLEVEKRIEEVSPWTGQSEPETVAMGIQPACPECLGSLFLDPWVRSSGCPTCDELRSSYTDAPTYKISEYQLGTPSGDVRHMVTLLDISFRKASLDLLAREMLTSTLAPHVMAFLEAGVALGATNSEEERAGEWRLMKNVFLAGTPQLHALHGAFHG